MPKDKRSRETTDHREAGDSREREVDSDQRPNEEYTGYRETRKGGRSGGEAEARREAELQPSGDDDPEDSDT